MSSLLVIGRLLWAPQTLAPDATAAENRTKFRLAFWMAAIAMGIQIAWVIPNDEIIRLDDKILQLWLNKMSGFAIGILLMIVFWGFEVLLLALMGKRGASKAIRGSFAPFLFLPAIAIPIHAWFPTGMSSMGYSWIVWLLIWGFMIWHAVWLAVLLNKGYSGIEMPQPIEFEIALFICTVMIIIELILVSILVVYIPPLFQVSPQEFLVEWF
jgi:hypothetical protein